MNKSQLRQLIREAIKESYINKGSRTLQVTDGNGRLVLITDPKDIENFLAGEEVYGEDKDGESIAVYLDSALDYQMAEGMSNEAIKENDFAGPPGPSSQFIFEPNDEKKDLMIHKIVDVYQEKIFDYLWNYELYRNKYGSK